MASISREYLTALRARRQAHQLASDILYGTPIDTTEFVCEGCGAKLQLEDAQSRFEVACHACGKSNPIPAHLRQHVPPPAELTYGPLEYGRQLIREFNARELALSVFIGVTAGLFFIGLLMWIASSQ